MTTGFSALGPDYIGSNLYRATRIFDRLNLADERYSRPLYVFCKGCRIAKRQEYSARRMFERKIEQVRLLGKRPSDEATANLLIASKPELLG